MAITSVGYDGTVDELAWTRLSAQLGQLYGVAGATDWAVTTTGADRTVSVAVGAGYGRGVLDTSDTAVTVQAAAWTTGTRWDTVVARRNWSTNLTTFAIITGTAVQQITRTNTTPGAIDEQPIALVGISANTGAPSSVVDLRVWPSKVLTVPNAIARDQLVSPSYGMEVVLADLGTRWRRGAAAWAKDRSALGDPLAITQATGTAVATPATGWGVTADGYTTSAMMFGNVVILNIVLRNISAGAIQAGANAGNFASTVLATVAAAYRPPVDFVNVTGLLWGGPTTASLSAYTGSLRIEPGGSLRLIGGMPAQYLSQRGADTGPSVAFTAVYYVQGTA